MDGLQFLHEETIDGQKCQFMKMPNDKRSLLYRMVMSAGGIDVFYAHERYIEIRDMVFKHIYVNNLIMADNYDKIIDQTSLNFEIQLFGSAVAKVYLKKELNALADLANGKQTQSATPKTPTSTGSSGAPSSQK